MEKLINLLEVRCFELKFDRSESIDNIIEHFKIKKCETKRNIYVMQLVADNVERYDDDINVLMFELDKDVDVDIVEKEIRDRFYAFLTYTNNELRSSRFYTSTWVSDVMFWVDFIAIVERVLRMRYDK